MQQMYWTPTPMQLIDRTVVIPQRIPNQILLDIDVCRGSERVGVRLQLLTLRLGVSPSLSSPRNDLIMRIHQTPQTTPNSRSLSRRKTFHPDGEIQPLFRFTVRPLTTGRFADSREGLESRGRERAIVSHRCNRRSSSRVKWRPALSLLTVVTRGEGIPIRALAHDSLGKAGKSRRAMSNATMHGQCNTRQSAVERVW